ncbi:MAG: anthranilate phosphoribosyltransferase [Planctomycetota bacterium]
MTPQEDPAPSRATPAAQDLLRSLVSGNTLGRDESGALFSALLGGGLEDAQIGAALALIQSRGATVDELVGAARVMRSHVTPVPYETEGDAVLVDTCGTGGATKTFNVSTVAAIVAASVEPPPGRPRAVVAKHGNRSRTGRGSAEVLAELGVNLDATPEQQARCLSAAGVCFSFAVRHHPAMRHAAGPRKALGFPTIFNLLGPLTNPAGATRQLLGVYLPELIEPVAQALAALGAERAIVAHGGGGLDELSTLGPSEIAIVEAGSVRSESVDAEALGLPRATLELVACDSVQQNAEVARKILDGEPGPRTDLALINAASALFVASTARSIDEGLMLARDAIGKGEARRTLDALAAVSHETA